MFRKDRIRRRGGEVILYIKVSIQAYEIKLEKEAECEEGVWCNIANSALTVGLVYRSPNTSTNENEKEQNAIRHAILEDRPYPELPVYLQHTHKNSCCHVLY